ncbi:GH25 family lysozyme [Lacticaseibacillus songhuajiangensis]|uniref:GH25 family lysozyme n=1 Tax=Lacticaseibacillus songhuajiangensis TaxID=1296539 RepID=UPI000F790C75|nr:GH25 family lysozyme [Lacticaseibacillus songhuajiangensis]
MTLNGIDVANYQAGIGKVAGDFRIIKATESRTYTNPAMAAQVKTAPSLKGFYHFASNGSVQGEADHFISKIKQYIGKAVLVLDYEPARPSVTWAKSWLDYVYAKTGVRPLIYMSLAVENTYDWSSVVKAGYGVWIAQYNNYNAVNGYTPRNLHGSLKHWKTMAMFQYTSSGRLAGWGAPLDFDVFYGDAKAWGKYAAVSGKVVASKHAPTKPAVKSKPAVKDKTWKDALGVTWTAEFGKATLKSAINLRWGATTKSSIIATLPAGSVVTYDAKCASGGYIWVRQPRSGGYGYLAVGRANGAGRNVDPYATFK